MSVTLPLAKLRYSAEGVLKTFELFICIDMFMCCELHFLHIFHTISIFLLYMRKIHSKNLTYNYMYTYSFSVFCIEFHAYQILP
jgi:hypothetical protein